MSTKFKKKVLAISYKNSNTTGQAALLQVFTVCKFSFFQFLAL